MKLANLARLYGLRLRSRLLQECFALAGIAAGVAVLFASQIAGQSLSSSVAQLDRGVVGAASLQVRARDANGFPSRLLTRVRRLDGVRRVAPLLEAEANARGPRASASVLLVGADESLASLGGALVRNAHFVPVAGIQAVLLPSPIAHRLGVTRFGEEVTLQVAGRTGRVPLYAQLHAREVGALVNSPVVVAPLEYVQELTGLGNRFTRVLVEADPGQSARVRAELARALAGSGVDVRSTDYEQRLFAVAAAATNQSTALFSLLSALVGFMFAFNAVLLTVPQRRRLIVSLRREGYTARAVIAVLAFDALALGAVASLLGLVLGDELSIRLFHASPGYLSSAFAVGSQRVVSVGSIAVALGGGMLASLVAVLSPLRDILSRNPLAAAQTRASGGARARGRWVAYAGGPACLGVAAMVLLAAPRLAIGGVLALVAALLMLLAPALAAGLALLGGLSRRITSAIPHVASMEVRSGGARTVAIAATGAVAVFGSVAVEGSRHDLLAGLDRAAHDMNSFTDVWVAPSGSFNLLMVEPFAPTERARIARVPGVRAVREYRGGLLDIGERRAWVIAPSTQARPIVPASQLLEGDPVRAEARLREGGWAVVSQALAREHHLHIGAAFVLPFRRPLRVRVAAISTNIGWAPGALVMSAQDYARAAASNDVAAFDVLLRPGVSQAAGVRAVRAALGPGSGLAVQSAGQHADRQRALARQGLDRLTQISTLILVAAILAMAGIAGATLWQRRPRLAKLKLEGFARSELWLTTLLESLLMLGVGCASGALLGLVGQQLLDRALAQVIGYPVVTSIALLPAILSIALVGAVALAVLAIPGWFAVRVPAGLALQEPSA